MRVRGPECFVVLVALAALAAASGPHARGQLSPPVARQVPATIEIHGRTLVDPYPWLEDASDPSPTWKPRTAIRRR